LLERLLSNKSTWVVHFSPGYDRLDEIKEGTVKDVFEELISSLEIELKGFTIWH